MLAINAKSSTSNLNDLISSKQAESTVQDYENVPIGLFGEAMLKGMGWSEKRGIGRNNENK